MDANDKKSGLTLALIGLLFSPLAPLAGGLIESGAIRHGASLATTFGLVLLLYGSVRIAKAKGHPWYVGLLGLFSCVGLAVLWFVVPDKSGSA